MLLTSTFDTAYKMYLKKDTHGLIKLKNEIQAQVEKRNNRLNYSTYEQQKELVSTLAFIISIVEGFKDKGANI